VSDRSAAAVIVAAGQGQRFGPSERKQYASLGGLPVLQWSIRSFRAHDAIRHIVVVLPPEDAKEPPAWLVGADRIVEGGDTRASSVARGVEVVPRDLDRILIHDGARPFASTSLIGRVCEAAVRGPVIPVLPLSDTIKEVSGEGRIVRTSDRSRLCRAQTPQGFPGGLFRRLCIETAPNSDVTDDAMLCEAHGIEVATVEGEPHNLKITSSEDLAFASWLVESGLITPP
jgi:2-C-methyl-D-erythritol 4-phosphate cytidylyltransferase